jgi:D-alanine-D-alanine ligase
MSLPTNIKNAPRRVVVAYTHFPDEMPDAQAEILDDVENVSQKLSESGFEPVPVPVTLNLTEFMARIHEIKPEFVFNLIDAIQEQDSLLYMVPSVLEAFQIPFTGVNARGNFLTTDKILSKEMMLLAGLPTARWQRCTDVLKAGVTIATPCILKPIAQDASRGIDEHSICQTPEEVVSKILSMNPSQRSRYFAECYIDGREFSLSVIDMADGARILPPAEMTFIDYPAGKFAIIDHKAKWVPDSFEFTHTVRRFDYPESDFPLLEEMKSISLRVWQLFGLTGYARVDFRVDRQGNPYVLEANANPCISPDAGFVAAGAKAGLSFCDLINAIVQDALRREAARLGDEEQKARRRARKKVLDKKR